MFSDVPSLIALLVAYGGAIWVLGVYINSGLKSVTALIYKKVDDVETTILSKFENHESQDNQRFSSVSDGIWDLRVRMAAKEGIISPHPIQAVRKD